MKPIGKRYLTREQAQELEKRGFIVKFVTITIKGILFEVWGR